MRIKEQEKRLTLNEHDDDDYDDLYTYLLYRMSEYSLIIGRQCLVSSCSARLVCQPNTLC